MTILRMCCPCRRVTASPRAMKTNGVHVTPPMGSFVLPEEGVRGIFWCSDGGGPKTLLQNDVVLNRGRPSFRAITSLRLAIREIRTAVVRREPV
jgi:hypothetical protein